MNKSTQVLSGMALLLAAASAIGLTAPAQASTAQPTSSMPAVAAVAATSAPSPVQALASWYVPGTTELNVTFAAPRIAADSYDVTLTNVTTGKIVQNWTLTTPPTVEAPLQVTVPNNVQTFVLKVSAVNSVGTSTESKAMLKAGSIEPVNMARVSLKKDTTNGGYLTVASWNAPNFSADGRITKYDLYDSNKKFLRQVEDTTVTLTREESDRANPALFIVPVSDSNVSGQWYRLGVTVPKDGYTVKITGAPAVATQGATITIKGSSTGYNPGNWVNAWVQQADGQWVDSGGNITEGSYFSLPATLKTSGLQSLQLSIGTYPENRWSNVVPINVAETPVDADSSTLTVTKKNDGAGHTYMVVTGKTDKVKPGGLVYLWVTPPGSTTGSYVMWTTVVSPDNSFTFDHVNAGTALSTEGVYGIDVSSSAAAKDTFVHTTYTFSNDTTR